MSPEVVFALEAEEQLVDLYRYIAVAGSPEAADHYTDSIVAFCEELAPFPETAMSEWSPLREAR